MSITQTFIDECVDALNYDDHLQRIEKALQTYMKDPEALKNDLPKIEIEDYLLHESKQMSIYHIKFVPQMGYPLHNHGMPVVSGVYQGIETNLLYKEKPEGGLEFVGAKKMKWPETYIMDDGILHKPTNHEDIDMCGFHIHVGDFYGMEHFVWNHETGEKFPYSDAKFVELANYPEGYDIPVVA